MKPLSRQRKWQKNRPPGLCRYCAKKVWREGSDRCQYHREKNTASVSKLNAKKKLKLDSVQPPR